MVEKLETLFNFNEPLCHSLASNTTAHLSKAKQIDHEKIGPTSQIILNSISKIQMYVNFTVSSKLHFPNTSFG